MIDKSKNAVNRHATSIHHKMDNFIFNNREKYSSMVVSFGISQLACTDIELVLLPCIILRASKDEISHVHNISRFALNKVVQDLCGKAKISSMNNFIYLFALYMIEQGNAYAQGISPKPSNSAPGRNARGKKRQRRCKNHRSADNEPCDKGCDYDFKS